MDRVYGGDECKVIMGVGDYLVGMCYMRICFWCGDLLEDRVMCYGLFS